VAGFVRHHQVVFPLTAGQLGVGRAMVSYAVPLSYAFLSHDQRHEVLSDSLFITVQPQPSVERPRNSPGAGSNVTLGLDAAPRDVATGEPIQVAATVTGGAMWRSGRADTALARRRAVYPGEVEVSLSPVQGLIAGTKTFHYLLVADSVGTYNVSPPAYAFFDLTSRRYWKRAGRISDSWSTPVRSPHARRAAAVAH